MLRSLEGVEQSYYVGVIALFKNTHFELGPSALIHLTLQCLLAHRLYGNELLSYLVHG